MRATAVALAVVAALLLARSDAAAAPLAVATGARVQVQPFAAYGATRDRVLAVTAPASFAAPVRVPAGGRLLTAVAVPDRIWTTSVVERAAPLRFRVTFETGTERHTLYERTIDIAGETRDRRWFDVGRDLSAFAGREGTLRFSTAPVRDAEGVETLALWAPPEVRSCAVPGPSLVLVVVDALRADRLSAAGYARPTTPHLDAFAAEATRFAAAFAAAPKTVPSVPQILTGSYFFRHRTTAGLAGFLGAGRFEVSRAVVNNPYVANWLTGEHPGFQTVVAGELDARAITSEALRWLSAVGRCPTALYLHYLDPHTPYAPPPRYARRFIDAGAPTVIGLTFGDVTGAWQGRYARADRRRIMDLYDGAVAWTDRQLGRLFRGLARRGRAERTLVIVTADHGEEFWEHGQFFHGQSLYDEMLHVPLLARLPGTSTGRVVPALVSTVDVVPTIADALGFPAVETDGVSLVPLARGAAAAARDRTVFATVSHAEPRSPPRHAVRNATHKLIRNIADGSLEVYDLVADPRERRNLRAAAPAATVLAKALDAVRLPLAERGYRLRVRSTADRPIAYAVTLAGRPAVPIVDPDRLTLERDDRLEIAHRASALSLHGTIDAGDADDVRMDILAPAGTLDVTITLDGAPAPAGTLRLGHSAGAAESPVALDDPALAGAPDATPATDAPPVTVALWRAAAPPAAPPPRPAPTLDAEARERLRALGYVE